MPVTTKMSELLPGDDVMMWFRTELPGWIVTESDEFDYVASSPTHDKDGVLVRSEDPQELVERVRTIERIMAILCERGGRVPVEMPVAGVGEPGTLVTGAGPEPVGEPVVEPARKPVAPVIDPLEIGAPTELNTGVYHMAKAMGYTGTICERCGSMKVVRTGKCETCTDCGTSPGCG